MGDMNKLHINLIGQTFGRLTVTELAGRTKRGQALWNCRCKCGNYKIIRGYHLTGEKIRSCGCLQRETVNIKWQGHEQIGRWVWNAVRARSAKRGIEFTLSAKDMWEIALKQNKKCALTGIDLVFVSNPAKQTDSNASLDRIDSNKGYTLDNVQWVLKYVNLAKRELSQNDFINICKKVADYNK